MSLAMKLHPFAITVLALPLATAGLARAEVAAVYAEGQGTEGSGSGSTGSGLTGLGYRLGARVLVFEGYLDHTGFGDGAAVTRGILGLRGGFGSHNVRVVLRAGAGVLEEDGGAVTGRAPGMPERRGAVGRVGGAIEGRLSSLFLLGLGVDGETFVLPGAGGSLSTSTADTGTVTGTDVFANLHLTFELGI
jgi:hypothetical protein